MGLRDFEILLNIKNDYFLFYTEKRCNTVKFRQKYIHSGLQKSLNMVYSSIGSVIIAIASHFVLAPFYFKNTLKIMKIT